MNTITLDTGLGKITGIDKETHDAFLGLPYARANRFEYATPIEHFDVEYNATEFGDACIQKRCYYQHLEIPERMFYYKEFRDGIEFSHSEDCLNLNIFKPKGNGPFPVLVFIHGGGFDSGCNYDSAIAGDVYAKKGIVCVSINYRVGIFGYLTHEDIKKKYGHDGNFGLDDQFTALTWIKNHISDFEGDPNNITVIGQSAGAMSIQYLCVSDKAKGLFNRAIMMSGAGLFPKFSLPRESDATHEYWLDVMSEAGVTSLDELKSLEPQKLFDTLEVVKSRRSDNTFNTMPVIDGYLIKESMTELIKKPHNIDYMIGYTNNDMYTAILAYISTKFAKQTNGFLYYFDVDAPGDDNLAFHSSDIRYVFDTLDASHRPYTEADRSISNQMIDYICSFVATGNPNHDGATNWKRCGRKPLRFAKSDGKPIIKMQGPNWFKLMQNTLKGDPK